MVRFGLLTLRTSFQSIIALNHERLLFKLVSAFTMLGPWHE